jgi:hypothetical protein
MRTLAAAMVVLVSGCGQVYDAVKQDKLQRNPGCNVPFADSMSAHINASDSISELTVCPAGPRGPAGFVIVKGAGKRSAYGDVGDQFFPNAFVETTAGCPGAEGDFTAARGFWAQVHNRLRERLIVQNGTGSHEDCGGASSVQISALKIVDWNDLDTTVSIVDLAMRDHKICSQVAIDVVGVECF